MEVKAVQNVANTTFRSTVPNAEKKQNSFSQNGMSLPDINSKTCALNIKVPQKYSHISSFDIPK